MTTLEALTSPALLLALAAYTVVSLLVEWLGRRLLVAVGEVESTHWLFERLLIPSARALALVVFILLAYPTLFGLTEAPSLGSLLNAERSRITHLVNLTFALSLLLPVLPVVGRLPALVLPIQGMAAASLLFHWWAASLPPRWLAATIATALRQHYEMAGMEALVYRNIILILQSLKPQK